MRFHTRQTSKGFTLIEIMVALTIFTLVVIMALGALLSVSDQAKQTLALRIAMDNVNIAMESMTRSLRMGKDFSCSTTGIINVGPSNSTNDCVMGSSTLTANSGIVFTSAEQPASSFDMGYKLEGRLNGKGNTIKKCTTVPLTCLEMVASNVNINTLKFYVTGSSVSDKIQPSVYIILKGSVTSNNTTIPFAVQTMASQRSSD